jgi:DNA polymerase-3 subunit delta'
MALAIMSAVRGQLDALPVLDRLALHQMADGLAGRQNDESYELFEDVLANWIHDQLVRAGRSGTAPARLAPLIEVWDKARASMRDAEIFNLDRRALILTLFADLSDAVRATRAA